MSFFGGNFADRGCRGGLVVGAEEQRSRTVNILNRDDVSTHEKGEQVPLKVAVEGLRQLKEERRLENRF